MTADLPPGDLPPNPGPAAGDGEENERRLLEIACTIAVSSLERVISTSLTEFLD
jgi:hypothetical protein